MSQWTLSPEMHPGETRFLLQLVAKCPSAATILEIGTGAGGTLREILKVLPSAGGPRVVVIDRLEYFPNQRETIEENLRTAGLEPSRVEWRALSSADAFAASRAADERFELIIVDASHSLMDVMLDLRWTTLLHVGGIVCVHDYARRFPGVWWACNRFRARHAADYDVIGCAGTLLALRKMRTGGVFLTMDWLTGWLRHAAAARSLASKWLRRRLRKLALRCLRGTEAGYREKYVRSEVRHLRRGHSHRTLGAAPTDNGQRDFEALQRLGLRPEHRVVDYGCGSLRLGRHLISFLDFERYWALDITNEFLRFGLDALRSSGALDLRGARFNVICRESLNAVAEWPPDVVVVAGVLQCIPPASVHGLMRQLAMICTGHTQVLISLLEAERTVSVGRYAFRHSLNDVAQAAASAGLHVAVLRRGLEPIALRGQLPDGLRHFRATVLMLANTEAAFADGALAVTALGQPVL